MFGQLPLFDSLVSGFSSAGLPCQDISGAGRQAGLSGERSGLLFEYLRLVGELRPRVVVAENVLSGQWRIWLDAIRCGLGALGYRVEALEIRASDVGAPHRRARVVVVAYADGERRLQPQGSERDERRWSCVGGAPLAHANGRRHEHAEDRGATRGGAGEERGGVLQALDDAHGEGRERAAVGEDGAGRGASRGAGDGGTGVEAQPGVGRRAHGLPAEVVLPSRWPAGRGEAQHAWEPPRTVEGRQPHRRAALKGYGNAVVPHVGREVGRWLVREGLVS